MFDLAKVSDGRWYYIDAEQTDEAMRVFLAEFDRLADAQFVNVVFEARPVKDVMATRLETVSPATPLRELLPMFAAGLVPIVLDGGAFVGLVTRMDVLGELRRRLARQ